MDTDLNEKVVNPWQNKIALIEILKDNNRLIFTAHDILIHDGFIDFKDRESLSFTFPSSSIKQIKEIKEREGEDK